MADKKLRHRLTARRFVRFSLRTLLVILTAVAVWMGIWVQRARDQRIAVDMILAKSGEVGYDNEIAERYWASGGKNARIDKLYSAFPPPWVLNVRNRLRPYVDRHFLDNVRMVTMSPNWMAVRKEFIAAYPDLNQSASGNQFRDYVVERYSPTTSECQAIGKLRHLEFVRAVFDDDDIDALSRLPRLRTLDCSAQLTASRVIYLQSLPQIKVQQKSTPWQFMGRRDVTPYERNKWKSQLTPDQDYENVRRLAEGEAIKFIPSPFPESRDIYYRLAHELQAQLATDAPKCMTLFWHGDEKGLTTTSLGFSRRNGHYLLGILFHSIGIDRQHVIGDNELKGLFIPGDMVVNASASREEIVDRLEQILRDDFGSDLSMSFETMDQEVYVAGGTFDLQLLDLSDPRIMLYQNKFDTDDANGGGGGSFEKFLDALGSRIGFPVISEVSKPPRQEIHWGLVVEGDENRKRLQIDPELVLQRVSEQTGLRFSKQTRAVEVLKLDRVQRP